MSDGTAIEWTDATLNVVNGCSIVSPGCTNCYAMRSGGRNLPNHPATGLTMPSKAGHVWTGEVRFNDKALLMPLRWKRPRKIFWNAHGDLFHEAVPDEWIDRCFAVLALTPHHIHQVLTKRPGRMREYLRSFENRPEAFGEALACVARAGGLEKQAGFDAIDALLWPIPNVWLGVSVEDQQRADERIPILLDTPAAVRWLSCEPLLGPVDLTKVDTMHFRGCELVDALGGTGMDFLGGPMRRLPKIDWVVAGGESGSGARPMHPDWARSLRDQCVTAGVPFLFKQWGEWAPDDGEGGCDHLDKVSRAPARNWADGAWHDLPKLISERDIGDDDVYRLGKKAAGRLLDGAQHDGYPA